MSLEGCVIILAWVAVVEVTVAVTKDIRVIRVT
jgi:hypothetical protein